MPELALVMWLVYGIGALGVRVGLHARRTGHTGLVGARAKPGSLPWVAEQLHVAALGLGLAAPILALLDLVEPIAAIDTEAVHVAGVLAYAAGLSLVIAAQAAMGTSWRIGTDPDERTELVTGGLFSIVRNPIYTGLVPTLLGLALVVPSVVALASVVLFTIALEIETRLIEEPHLLRVHGEVYAEYASRVGRFVPGIGLLDRAGR